MLRVFRSHWKNLFMIKYPSKSNKGKGKHFHWIPSTRRTKVRQFWLDQNIEGIDNGTYHLHEYVLFKMIFHTYSDQRNPKNPAKLDNLETHQIKVDRTSKLDNRVIKKLFGPAPNLLNMQAFFGDKTIRLLWWE